MDDFCEVHQQLIESARNGRVDHALFERTFRRYYPKVLRMFQRAQLNLAESEELAQQTFLVVYESVGTCKISFRGWLFSVARNQLKTLMRRRGTKKRQGMTISLQELSSEPDVALAQHSGSLVRSVESAMIDEERKRLLRSAISRLPDRMQHCVELRVLYGLSIRDISTILRIAEGTVRAVLHQAREKLKLELSEHFDGIEF